MTTYSKGRRGRPWRRLRMQVLRANPVCSLCGGAIDLAIPAFDPVTGKANEWSGTVDHILPLVDYPHLALEPSNLRSAHYGCNTKRGKGTSDRARLATLGHRSRRW